MNKRSHRKKSECDKILLFGAAGWFQICSAVVMEKVDYSGVMFTPMHCVYICI